MARSAMRLNGTRPGPSSLGEPTSSLEDLYIFQALSPLSIPSPILFSNPLPILLVLRIQIPIHTIITAFSADMSYLDTDFDAGESSPSEDSEDDSEDLSDAEVTPTVKKNLKALISDSLVISNFDDRSPKYCPRGVLESLLTRDAIQEALFPMQEDQFLHDGELSTADKKFLDLIEESAKRVFAIALLSSQIDCDRMREALRILIVKNHFTDKDVPIKNPIRANAANPKAKPKWPKAFMEWELEEQSISTRFYDTQWSFLSPTFVKGVNKDVPLHSKHILPFQRQMTISTPGAFSRVYQVLIHPNHFLDQGV